MAKHEHAFDKGTDEDKLKATSEQYQEQTGQGDVEAGPDPVVEAQDKAVADLKLDPIRDQAQVQKDLEKAIAESKDDA